MRLMDIIIGMLGVFVAFSFIGADDCLPAPEDRAAAAEQQATRYLDALASKIEGKPICSGADSDQDGYVSCSYRGVDEREPRSILCSYNAYGSGCKKAPEQVVAPKRRGAESN